jgi:hypothetical protein
MKSAISLVLLFVSCAGPPEAPSFRPEELPELVLQPSEVPEPYVVAQARSGYISEAVDQGTPPSHQPIPLEPASEVYLYRAFYTQPEMARATVIPDGTRQFVLHIWRYEEPEAAANGVRRNLGPDRPPGFTGDLLPVEGLGAGAGRYESLPTKKFPYRTDFIVWRRANLVLNTFSTAASLSDAMEISLRFDARVMART